MSSAASTWRSPTGVSLTMMPRSSMAQPEAQVGHDRDHHGVAGQLARVRPGPGEQGQQLVPVDQRRRRRSDGQQPVGVAVEGQAQVRPVLDHRAGQGGGGGRAAPVIDVGPVGLAADGHHLGPQPLVDGARPARRRPRWHCRPPAGARPGGGPSSSDRQVVDVGRPETGLGPDSCPTPWPSRRRGPLTVGSRTRSSSSSMAASVSALSLVPTGGEQLDAVVGEGIVGGRDHRRGDVPLRRQPGQGRGRQHTDVDHVGPLAGQPGRQGAPGAWGPTGGCPDRPGRWRRRWCGPRPARGPATSSGVSSTLATPRTPSVPNRVRGHRPTAWSTGAPCGPSSGRTSSTPSPGRRG